jgi:hypothetical protein
MIHKILPVCQNHEMIVCMIGLAFNMLHKLTECIGCLLKINEIQFDLCFLLSKSVKFFLFFMEFGLLTCTEFWGIYANYWHLCFYLIQDKDLRGQGFLLKRANNKNMDKFLI